jgi:Na+/H+ antiporter NhaD/arsenite permease-like protein
LLAAILIFAATYLTLAVGRIPFLRVDRTGAAIVGASLMLAFNVLTVEEAYAAINFTSAATVKYAARRLRGSAPQKQQRVDQKQPSE